MGLAGVGPAAQDWVSHLLYLGVRAFPSQTRKRTPGVGGQRAQAKPAGWAEVGADRGLLVCCSLAVSSPLLCSFLRTSSGGRRERDGGTSWLQFARQGLHNQAARLSPLARDGNALDWWGSAAAPHPAKPRVPSSGSPRRPGQDKAPERLTQQSRLLILKPHFGPAGSEPAAGG